MSKQGRYARMAADKESGRYEDFLPAMLQRYCDLPPANTAVSSLRAESRRDSEPRFRYCQSPQSRWVTGQGFHIKGCTRFLKLQFSSLTSRTLPNKSLPG
jgi:hypothetical protein